METPKKYCTGCGETKALSEFHKDRSKRDGHSKRCKTCRNIYQKVYRETHKANAVTYQKTYRKSHKAKAVVRQRVYRQTHKLEIVERQKTYRETHRAEIAKQRKAYYELHKENYIAYAHNRRIDSNGIRLTAEVVEEAIALAGDFCCWCNTYFEEGHLDHIQPISRGGTNDPDNLVYICAPCNLSKNDKTILEFLLYRMENHAILGATGGGKSPSQRPLMIQPGNTEHAGSIPATSTIFLVSKCLTFEDISIPHYETVHHS